MPFFAGAEFREKKRDRDHEFSGVEIIDLAEGYFDLLYILSGCFGQENPLALLEIIHEMGWYPGEEMPYTPLELEVFAHVDDFLDLPRIPAQVSPPSTPGAMLHWRVLSQLLPFLSEAVQDCIHTYIPEIMKWPVATDAEDWEPECFW